MSTPWFTADREGLSKLVADRPKSFIIFELLQNAWDEDGVTRVDVALEKLAGRPQAVLTVEDDSPEGFKDLSHAFTLFAQSYKKDDPGKRGRFNLGEKLVLALCSEARVETTTGMVTFDNQGRHLGRTKRLAGSKFTARMKMNQGEFDEACSSALRVFAPAGLITTFNGSVIEPRTPLAVLEATLPTVLADDEGMLRQTRRKTRVEIYEPEPGETPSIYEMGIPVVDTGDRWHVNICQKVPVNMNRDNVTPSYLRKVRTLVLNHMHEKLTKDEATSTWVHDAMGDKDATSEAVKGAFVKRFGERAVVYDPSDPEANNKSMAQGRPVIYGGSLSKDAWKNVRTHGAALPAGQVTPSKGGTVSARPVSESEWTPGMKAAVALAKRMAKALMGVNIRVVIHDNADASTLAQYGSRTLTLNLGNLGKDWFEKPDLTAIIDLFIHEFGHEYSSNHLSSEYHDALTLLGAKATVLALSKPEVFDLGG